MPEQMSEKCHQMYVSTHFRMTPYLDDSSAAGGIVWSKVIQKDLGGSWEGAAVPSGRCQWLPLQSSLCCWPRSISGRILNLPSSLLILDWLRLFMAKELTPLVFAWPVLSCHPLHLWREPLALSQRSYQVDEFPPVFIMFFLALFPWVFQCFYFYFCFKCFPVVCGRLTLSNGWFACVFLAAEHVQVLRFVSHIPSSHLWSSGFRFVSQFSPVFWRCAADTSSLIIFPCAYGPKLFSQLKENYWQHKQLCFYMDPWA